MPNRLQQICPQLSLEMPDDVDGAFVGLERESESCGRRVGLLRQSESARHSPVDQPSCLNRHNQRNDVMRYLMVGLMIAASPLPALAGQIQTARLVASRIPDNDPQSNNPLIRAWKHELAGVAADRAPEKHDNYPPSDFVDIWTATFKSIDRTIVVSILGVSNCTEYSGAGVAASIQTCPAKIITLQHGHISHIQSIPHYTFAFPVIFNKAGDAEDYRAEAASGTDLTLLTFDPSTRQLTLKMVANGKPSQFKIHTHSTVTVAR